MVSNPRVSVIVCTYNREDLLPSCLQSLCAQTLPPSAFEIIVVDNASTDRTPEIVKQFQQDFPQYIIRYQYETKQGLGFSRNTGFQEAQSAYVAYIDDDAMADSRWLEHALSLLLLDPSPICVGGDIGVFYTVSKPDWFKDQYEIRTFGTHTRYLTQGESFSGSNMIWDVTYLKKYGGFAVDKGVQGEFISVGEETDVFSKIWQTHPNPIFLYDPELKVQHFVAPIKLTLTYRCRRHFVTGQVMAKDAITAHEMSHSTRIKIAIKQVGVALKVLSQALGTRSRHPYWQTWVAEDLPPFWQKLGYIATMLGFNIQFRRD